MRLVCVALVSVWWFVTSPLSADVLWHQPWDGVSRGSPAQEFTDPDNRVYSVWLFDDFTVPEPGWWIERVTVYGSEQGTSEYNLGVYLSLSPAPHVNQMDIIAQGMEVVLEPGSAPLRRRANLVFDLGGLYLPPGRYFLSAWVRRPFDPGGQWFWLRTSPTLGEPFYLHNPGGGWGFGGDLVGGGWLTEQDLSFTIEGRTRITITGTVELQEYAGDRTTVPVTIEIREPDTLNAVETHVVQLDSTGRYSFHTLLQGSYDLSAKAPHWLRQTLRRVTLQAGAQVDFSLVNGDVDGDNEVSLSDFGWLVAAFGSVPGDANWSPNADLNGDEEVSLLDLGILVRHFGVAGDE